jgi:pantoate--beta-alanine ligase
MILARTIVELGAGLAGLSDRADAGLVPTMGAFHDGHRSLFAAARGECRAVVVSLFVNPAQFGPGEDLANYPRDEARDASVAEAAGVDVLFVPEPDEIYPPGFDTWVDPGALGSILEGAARPGHFRGAATVCLKLFHLVRPRRAYFGRKDAQQVAVIRAMLRDLDLDPEIELRVLPTVRDADGLALSSRNAYLSPEERHRALALPSALQAGLAAHRSGGDAVREAREALDRAGGLVLDYVAVADFDGPTLAAAVRIGPTRLIDNVLLSGEDSAEVIDS